jgi:hypothetical protein
MQIMKAKTRKPRTNLPDLKDQLHRARRALGEAVRAVFPDFSDEERLKVFNDALHPGSPLHGWLQIRCESQAAHARQIRERLGFLDPQPPIPVQRRLDTLLGSHVSRQLEIERLLSEQTALQKRCSGLEREWAVNYRTVLAYESGGVSVCVAVAALWRSVARQFTWRFYAAKWEVLGWWGGICDRVKGYFAAGPQGGQESCYKFLDNSARREETAKEVWECGPNGTLHPPRTYTSCNGKISPQADCRVHINGVPINSGLWSWR